MCSGRKVLIGTTTGVVAIFDSQTVELLNSFKWHKDKVRMLLAIPRQVEPCICAEIPFPEQETTNRNSRASSQELGEESPSISRRRTAAAKKQAFATQPQRSFNSQFSYLENKYYLQNPEPESAMIVSVGNGKEAYIVHAQTKEERVKAFDKAAMRKSAYRMGSKQQWEDVVLLTWRI